MRWMRVTSGSDAEVRSATRATSEAEMRPSARRSTPPMPVASARSEKMKKLRRPAKTSPRYSCALSARELMAVLAVIGPVGTFISLWVLPATPPAMVGVSLLRQVTGAGAAASGSAGRVIHLSLAGTGRKARYVLPEGARWDDFTFGVQERLRLSGMSRIETSAGEAIMSVEDLVHDDTIVIYSDEALPRHGGGAGGLLFSMRGSKQDSVGPVLTGGKAPSLPAPVDALWRRRKPRPSGDDDATGGTRGAGKADQALMPRLFEKNRAGRRRREAGSDTPADGGYAAETASVGDGDEVAEEAHAREIERARARQRQWQQKFTDQNEGTGHAALAAPAQDHGHADPALPPSEAESIPTDGEPCGDRHPDFRIAMVIPWVGPLPPWTPYFVASARPSAPLADFLIFHEAHEEGVPRDSPDNVHFFDLGLGGLSMLIGMQLGEALNLPIRNATVVIKALRFMLDKWPRLVAEYKPTFGSVFAQYLKGYTHWGYCDLDMVIGNLPLFIERSELEMHDLVTYSFGDQEAFYLRGQWTVHRNEPRVSAIWQGCDHLAGQLQKELLLKVAWVRRMESRGIANYPKRFQSAEGCYSHRAVQAGGISFKMSTKQFVGLATPGAVEPAIYSVDGSVWRCDADARVDVEELARHSAAGRCLASLPGAHLAAGRMEPLDMSPDGCGRWMPFEFRMCAPGLLTQGADAVATTSTFFKGGQFYGQRFRHAPGTTLDNGCQQLAFFHFQEWKKNWDGSGATTIGIEPVGEAPAFSARPRNFTVRSEGISLIAPARRGGTARALLTDGGRERGAASGEL